MTGLVICENWGHADITQTFPAITQDRPFLLLRACHYVRLAGDLCILYYCATAFLSGLAPSFPAAHAPLITDLSPERSSSVQYWHQTLYVHFCSVLPHRFNGPSRWLDAAISRLPMCRLGLA